MFFNQKPMSNSVLAMTTIHQFQISRLKLHMVFTQKFRVLFQNFYLHFWETYFFNLLRPLSLPFYKIKGNHSDSMFYYLKNYLFLMADFGFGIPWITLTQGRGSAQNKVSYIISTLAIEKKNLVRPRNYLELEANGC